VILSRLLVIINASSTQFLLVLLQEIPLVCSLCYTAVVDIGSPYVKKHI
jgi:hypothetical protein